MARKSIKGYAEKNYYDNIRFNGIVATNDPLNEGSFKHLVNFDIADTGQSLTPRKGFLTTTLKHHPKYTIPKDLKVALDGDSLYITGYEGSLKNINIPTRMLIDNRIYPIIGIGENAFSQNDVENIIINDSINYISGYAFYYCDDLLSIKLPNSLTNIGSYAFSRCSSLTSIVIPESVTIIGESVFSGCSSLRNVTLPEGTVSIANGLFENCENLANITLPKTTTCVGAYAFSGCSSLNLSRLPNNLTSIEHGAFSHCKSINTLVLPSGLTTIRSNAFEFCKGLTKIYIPKSVTTIERDAFKGCNNLIIYCEAGTQLSAWSSDWNPERCSLVEDTHLDNFNSDLNEPDSTLPDNLIHNNTATSEVEISISNRCIYYFDANISRWVFIDLESYSEIDSGLYIPDIYLVDFSVEDNYIKGVHKVSRVEFINIKEPWSNYIDGKFIKDTIFFSKINVYNNQALPAIDEYGITHNIIKIYKGVDTGWLSLNYRKDDSEYEGQQYLSDTLVISMLDTEDIVDSVNTVNRNIASFKSIIPNPMQAIYTEENKPLGFIQKFPMIYAKQKNKYLINTINNIDGLELFPNFYLKDFEDNEFIYKDEEGNDSKTFKYTWAYAYDIASTNNDFSYTNDSEVYKSPIVNLNTNEVLLGYTPNRNFNTDYGDTYRNNIKAFDTQLYEVPDSEYPYATTANLRFKNLTYNEYSSYINKLDILESTLDKAELNKDHTIILYIVPDMNNKEPTKIPSGIFPKDDRISLLTTAWYSNTTYNFNNIPVLNVPAFTTEFNSMYGGILSEEVPNFDFSKEEDIPGEHSQVVYNTIFNKLSIFNEYTSIKDIYSSFLSDIESYNSIESILTKLEETQTENLKYWFYVKKLSDIQINYNEDNKIFGSNLGYTDIKETALVSDIVAFNSEGLTIEELRTYLKNLTDIYKIILCPKLYCKRIAVPGVSGYSGPTTNRLKEITKLLPGVLTEDKSYFVCFNHEKYSNRIDISTSALAKAYDTPCSWFSIIKDTYIDHDRYMDMPFTFLPNLNYISYKDLDTIEVGSSPLYESLFSKDNAILKGKLDSTQGKYLSEHKFFDTGVVLTMYLLSMPSKEYLKKINPNFNSYTRDYFINTTSLVQSRQLVIDDVKPTTYVEYLTDYPNLIKYAKEYFVFNSTLGDHLVTYADNKVFISKPGLQYYFTEDNVYSFPETIVKALQYKDTILVFTTQNLYSIYLTEYVTNVPNGTDEEGNIKYVQQTTYVFATLPVLYNLLVDPRYKDAIQVYNQMILFYSADGQMFLIKPTAAIDSNTRFSIQYFNKSANDILLNYKDYMQERLKIYGVDKVIDEVNIKVSTSINYIKIFYSAPNIMTYILIYDIINNRYYVYDTLAFTNIKSLHNIPMGEMYIIEDGKRLYFTLPNNNINGLDTNVDISSFDNFSKNPIKCEIDTGTINLNNHLKKRFKELHVTYKNLSSSILEFSLDTYVDEVPIITYLSNTLEVKDFSGSTTLVPVETIKSVNLIESNTLLFNFTDYTSNKFITHKSNITSRGKTIRTKLYFSSKGKYKIQGFGLIYKEHTV